MAQAVVNKPQVPEQSKVHLGRSLTIYELENLANRPRLRKALRLQLRDDMDFCNVACYSGEPSGSSLNLHIGR